MTPSELNQFLNTPKTSVTEFPKTNTLNYGTILFAGVAVGAIIYAVYLYRQNAKLRSGINENN